MAEPGVPLRSDTTAVGPIASTAREPDRPLRDPVLAGQFFGERHAAGAADLAAFLHGGGSAYDALRTWFGEAFVRLLAAGREALRAAIDRDITEIDAALGVQVDAILHAPRFQQLEGRWRGLAWLIAGVDPGAA